MVAVNCDKDKIFATARGYGDFKSQWEFSYERNKRRTQHKRRNWRAHRYN